MSESAIITLSVLSLIHICIHIWGSLLVDVWGSFIFPHFLASRLPTRWFLIFFKKRSKDPKRMWHSGPFTDGIKMQSDRIIITVPDRKKALNLHNKASSPNRQLADCEGVWTLDLLAANSFLHSAFTELSLWPRWRISTQSRRTWTGVTFAFTNVINVLTMSPWPPSEVDWQIAN